MNAIQMPKRGDIVFVRYLDHFVDNEFESDRLDDASGGVELYAIGMVAGSNDNYLFITPTGSDSKLITPSRQLEGIVRSCITELRTLK